MDTKIVRINEVNKDEAIKEAGHIIQRGGVVAFPTETVYGLGANALDKSAVKKIFIAKGRPQDNPLIVHVADKKIDAFVKEIPPLAATLMEKFWPGPLTIIFKKSELIPEETSANLDTIGIRMPKNELALRLIKESGTPIAAPSANRSGKPSPTTMDHVVNDLNGRIDYILGGDMSEVGVESTIIDCTVTPPCVLRPGGISLEALQRLDQTIYIDPHILVKSENIKAKAPGMKYRHYAPNAPLTLVDAGEDTIKVINDLTKEYQVQGLRVGILCTDETHRLYSGDEIHSLGSRAHLETVAQELYDALRLMDAKDVDVILCETFEEKELGITIMNRLKKAAGFKVIKSNG